jgi:hypothetical protein
MKRTATAQLVELKLGEPLEPFVVRLRNDERSWPYIARKLRERTGDTVPFSAEALRKWFLDHEPANTAA